MGSVRSGAALAADFPTTNARLQSTIDRVDYMTQNGELSGAGLAQALGAIGSVMDTYGEAAQPPTAGYTCTAGPTARYYAALIEYPLTIDNPPRPFPFRNVYALSGQPIAGRSLSAADRTKRYSKASTAITVNGAAAALDAND